jgi:PAS domain S-box-containing protein
MAMVQRRSADDSSIMPTTHEARRAVPAGSWSRRQPLLSGGLFVLWCIVLLYAAIAADDFHEVLLDVVALGLGLLVAATTVGRSLQLARRRMQTAERRLEALSTSDVLTWECDAAGRAVFFSERATDYFGWSPEELVGTDVGGLLHPQEVERLAALMAEGRGWSDERWRCLHRDGSEHWFVGSAVPNVTPDGRVVGFVGSARPLGKDALDEQRLSEIANRVYERLHSGEIQPVFQPILSVSTGRLIGAEGLSRFPGSDRYPDQWFNDAAEVGLGVELELEALRRLLSASRQLPEDLYVSLNVSPHTLLRAELLELLVTAGIPTRRIVLEITEHASITEYDEVLAAVAALRAVGVRLAVDDAGAGYSSFRHILRLAPEIIKLDRSLIAGLHVDPALRALASAVVTFGLEMSATVTAEGIETPEELRCAQDLGIHSAQGYLFGKPVADWSTWREWHARGAVYSVAAAGISTSAAG